MCEILPGRFFRREIFYCAEEPTLMLKCTKLLLKCAHSEKSIAYQLRNLCFKAERKRQIKRRPIYQNKSENYLSTLLLILLSKSYN